MDYIQLKTKEGENLSRLLNLDPKNALKNLMVYSEILEPGLRSSRNHRHTTKEECVIVQEGELSVYKDGELKRIIKSGEAFPFPANGEFHFLKNDSNKSVRYISVATGFSTDKVEFKD
jgi:uncharacterized cupin superfamily protein